MQSNDKGIMDENEINESIRKINNNWEKSKNISEENFKKNIQNYEKNFAKTNSYEILVELIKNIEKFIDTFNQMLIYKNKTLFDKFNVYTDYLFNYYLKALLNESIEKSFIEHINERFISYITLFKKYDINLFVEKISEFKKIPEYYYYLMIEILKSFLENGMILLEKNKNHASNEFNEGIFFSLKYDIEKNIKSCSEKLNQDYFYYYDHLELELKKIKIENIMSTAEESLIKGDNEEDNETQNNYYNIAIDKYREAYKIIMDKITIDQLHSNTLKRDNSISYFHLLYLKPKNDYKEDDSSMIPDTSQNNSSDIQIEAKCLSRIIYIIYIKLKNNKNVERLLTILQHCSQLLDSIDKSNIEKENWYLDILKMKNQLNKELDSMKEKSDIELIEKNKKKYPQKYKDIENNFKEKPNIFIKFILEKYPYKNYQKDEFNIDEEMKNRPGPFLCSLHQKHHPDNYPKNNETEKDIFCLMSFIDSKISQLINSLYPNKSEKKLKKKKKKK